MIAPLLMPNDDLVAIEKRLFTNQQSASMVLNDLTRDKYADLEHESAHEWQFRIVPSTVWRVRQDPDLAANLVASFGLALREIGTYAHLAEWQDGKRLFLRTLDHTWALWAWSNWLQRLNGCAVGRPIIIHLDDHDDLRSPPLRCTGESDVFVTPIGHHRVCMRAPESVAVAIHRGFIGIGGFLTPFLHTLQTCDIIHLRLHMPERPYYHMHALHIASEDVYLDGITLRQPVAKIVETQDAPREAPTYVCSNDLALLSALPADGRRVLLDIDMDFFCNRQEGLSGGDYNGSASLDDVHRTIDTLVSILSRSGIKSSVEVITLALSPPFFPSGYWTEALPHLEKELQNVLDV